MKILIIGCGLIGRKRALALDKDDVLVGGCDTNEKAAEEFSKQFNCKAYVDYKRVLNEIECDAVIVSVVNKYIKEIVIEAIKKGKHVLVEKPLGRNIEESKIIIDILNERILADKKYLVLKVGFNHRFHPAVMKAKKIFDNGIIGSLLLIRAKYGHGGRPGMEKEWRASPDLCGGGELLDQGVHLIDLCRYFAGSVKSVFGVVRNKFWKMKVEDNAFTYMESKNGANIQFHISWTNWRNVFQFEIFGDKGYLIINGLGGSYGEENLEFGRRKMEGGKPDIKIFRYPLEDVSWKEEWLEFKSAIKERREPIGSGFDGLEANKIIDKIYKSSMRKKIELL